MRWLATAALSYAAAVFAANYILPEGWLLVLALLFAGLGAALLCLRRKWLRAAILALFAFAVGLGGYSLHSLRTTVPARELDGQTLEIKGKLLEYPQVYEDYCRVRILLQTEGMPRVETLFYDSSMALADAEPGQTVTAMAKLSAADVRYGEDYDAYNAKDIYLTASAKSELVLEKAIFDLSLLPVRISRSISEISDQIFPEDTTAFMKSLLLGDKSDLYEDEGLSLAMSRAGLMHIVAVSGMHIAFLVGFLQLLLGKTRRSSFLCILLIWLFVLLTGASPSAVRAGIMQSLLLFASIVRRENDPITSLSAALGLLLLMNPYAAASISLQLSFAAMAGILCFAERLNDRLLGAVHSERLRFLLRYPVSIASSSVSVMIFTMPLMALHFGYIPLLSPLSNILCLWAVTVCFCGGAVACVLAATAMPLGIAVAWLVAWPARYLMFIAGLVSAVPFSTIYMQGFYMVVWLALGYAFFLLAALSRARLSFKLLYPTLLSAAVLTLTLLTVKNSYASGSGVITVLDVGQGQCISVFSGDKTLMIDCGGLWTLQNAGETAGAYLKSCGRNKVDTLLLTHLHADHANGVTMLLEMTDVGEILMPSDPNDEDGLYEKVLYSASRHNVPVRTISDDEQLQLGAITAYLYAPGETGGANERCVTAMVSIADYDMLVTADLPKSAEKELVETYNFRDVELLIAGHHGSRYASSGELLGSIGADTAVISVGYNTYGHPTYETLERLTAYGYTIYRTDLNGTIEIRIR